MKTLYVAIVALTFAATASFAQESQDNILKKEEPKVEAPVPTGCTYYVIDPKTDKVVVICEPSKPGNPLFWEFVTPPGGGSE